MSDIPTNGRQSRDSALGLLETQSIALGYYALDELITNYHVEILISRIICPGRFFLMYSGDISTVREADDYLRKTIPDPGLISLFIGVVHDEVIDAIDGSPLVHDPTEALGIIECRGMAQVIYSADIVCKTAHVNLLNIHHSVGSGGKGTVFYSGSVAAVKTTLEAIVSRYEQFISQAVVITGPSEQTVRSIPLLG